MTPELYTYDIETYPNVFTYAVERYSDRQKWLFEMSFRRDDTLQLMSFLNQLKNSTVPVAQVGFNSIGFDYPIVHQWYMSGGAIGYQGAYTKCDAIINGGDNFGHLVWESDWIIPQIDLYKIHHFDNQARRTGLKQVEFNKRVANLQDLPFPPGIALTSEQIDILIDYNMNGDVVNTREFLTETLEAIEFRRTFGSRYVNFNDTKVGKQYFIKELEEAGVACYGDDKQPIQTKRPKINLGDAVFPYVRFNHPEFQRIHKWFTEQIITETKGIFKDIECTVDDFTYVFGLGGIHGSVESQTVYSDDDWIIEDWDVKSYYPNLAIKNKLFPAHLSEKFCEVYQDVYEQRTQHAKGTPQNAVMKLALNGVYGDSNSKFSPFYDPLYTMSVTINGQLLLCMLAESLRHVSDLTMIQINTDGLTVRYPRSWQHVVHELCQQWEKFTMLELEHVEYQRMHVRDVNNYMAVKPDGEVKRKGAYEHEREHHQNHSALVVPKAAEMVLTQGIPIEMAVLQHTDIYDFCLRVKAPQIELDGVPQQGTCRYYVSTTGGTLKTIKPPPRGMVAGDFKKAQGVTNQEYWRQNQTGLHNPLIHTKNFSKYGPAIGEVEKGWKATVCNNIMDCSAPINYQYYIDRVRKLVDPVTGVT